MSTWTKKAMFVGLPRYLEQLLGACYAKEGWELYRFRAVEGERPPQGIHTYDCEVDSAEAAQVFSVQNLDLLVYRLERDPSVAMRRLDALLRMAQESAVKQVFLLSDDEVFASGTQPTERDAVNPQNADGRVFMRQLNRLIQDIEIKLHLPFVLRLKLTDFQLHGYHCLQATVV